MRRTTFQFMFLAFVSTLVLAACTKKHPHQGTISVRLQWLHQAQFAGFYAARERGFLEHGGLDVVLKPGGPDFNALTLVSAGSDFAGVTTADQIILARSRGAPIKAIFTVFRESPVCFLAKKSSNIRLPADFVGKRVGMKYGYDTETELSTMLTRAGIVKGPKGWPFVEIPVKFEMERFFDGDIDVWPGFVINEKLTAMERGVPVEVILSKDNGVHAYADTVFVRDESIDAHRGDIQTLCSGLRKGWAWALDNPEEAVTLVQKYNPSANRQHEQAMLKETDNLVRGADHDDKNIGVGSRKLWAEMLKDLENQGLIQNRVAVVDFVSDICGLVD